ncbi:MAG: DNA polymerase III subunit beta [Flavobacteriales bacterium]|nr:DNA polymerase III subunit beta [Flavobacteriales bacterium]
MKFIVTSNALLKQLQMLSGVLNSSNTLPILDYFLFDLKKNQAVISASDLETTMTTKMEVKSEEEGTIAMPAKLLIDTLKAFPSQPLTFSIDPASFAIEISCDFGKYKLTGANGEEFPQSPALEGEESMEMDSDVLVKAINSSLFAAGNDDLRPVMSGLLMEMYSDNVRFVATDAHRLVRYTRTDVGAASSKSLIVPKKPLTLLKNNASSAEGNVSISYTDNNALFTFDDVTLMCRLIEGKYPNYEAVIPKDNPNKMTVGREDLLKSVKRVSIFANKTTHQVRLKLTGSELSISAEDLDFANEANERLTCSYQGEDMEIGFNSRFLIDMLSNLKSENIVLELSAPNRAGIILPAENDEAQEDMLMLVMPVMLNS